VTNVKDARLGEKTNVCGIVVTSSFATKTRGGDLLKRIELITDEGDGEPYALSIFSSKRELYPDVTKVGQILLARNVSVKVHRDTRIIVSNFKSDAKFYVYDGFSSSEDNTHDVIPEGDILAKLRNINATYLPSTFFKLRNSYSKTLDEIDASDAPVYCDVIALILGIDHHEKRLLVTDESGIHAQVTTAGDVYLWACLVDLGLEPSKTWVKFRNLKTFKTPDRLIEMECQTSGALVVDPLGDSPENSIRLHEISIMMDQLSQRNIEQGHATQVSKGRNYSGPVEETQPAPVEGQSSTEPSNVEGVLEKKDWKTGEHVKIYCKVTGVFPGSPQGIYSHLKLSMQGGGCAGNMVLAFRLEDLSGTLDCYLDRTRALKLLGLEGKRWTEVVVEDIKNGLRAISDADGWIECAVTQLAGGIFSLEP